MALAINTNIYSLIVQRNLEKTGLDLALALQRLSSGLRVNSAKDDPAASSTGSRMTSQIMGTRQAILNANNGVSFTQLAESAMQSVLNDVNGLGLQRLRELAVEAADTTLTATDRANIQAEVLDIKNAIDDIARRTEFNGRKVFDGRFGDLGIARFQTGFRSNQTVDITIPDAQTNAIGNFVVESDNGKATAGTDIGGIAVPTAAKTEINNLAASHNNVAKQTLNIAGNVGSRKISIEKGDSAKQIVQKVNDATAQTGVTATTRTKVSLRLYTSDTKLNTGAGEVNGPGTITFELYGDNTAAIGEPRVIISANVSDTTTQAGVQGLIDVINTFKSRTGIEAQYDAVLNDGSITLFHASGADIKIGEYGNSAAGASTARVTGEFVPFTIITEGLADSVIVGGKVTFQSSAPFNVSSDVTTITGSLLNKAKDETSSSVLRRLSDVSLATVTGANDAIPVIDAAITFVNSLRARLGAAQSRLESTISHLTDMQTFTEDARSRVLDADFAAETANLTRAQILQEAGIAMLAQANSLPQQVLALLRG